MHLAQWHALMMIEAEWSTLVASMYFEPPLRDRDKAMAGEKQQSHACGSCGQCFPSAVAVAPLEWLAHGERSDTRLHALSPTCQAHMACFHDVLRTLAHLCYTRTHSCIGWLREQAAPMTGKDVAVLDAELMVLRAQFMKNGYKDVRLPAVRPTPPPAG